MRGAATTIAVVALIAPHFLHAAVLINEIAWMGNADSANNEWIELYNNGSSEVLLDGWVLTDASTLEIELAGTIGAGEYVVLERTDDSSAPGIAFLIYTGALGNDGRTVALKRPDNSVEDQVVGGENWENIGGSNETKDTAQRTGAGWVTAPATPGKVNGGTPTVLEKKSTTQTSTKPDEEKPEKISLVLPNTDLQLLVNAPTVAYVNQSVSFSVDPSGIGEALLESLKYTWNFGDTYTGAGKEIVHSFSHPGDYLIVVEAAYARHNAMGRHEISVLPYTLTLTKETDETLTITNNTPFESDLSGFILQGDTRIVFPRHTYLLPNSNISINAARVQKGIVKTVTLLDARGNIVALYTPNLESDSLSHASTSVFLGNELIEVEETPLKTEPLSVADTPSGDATLPVNSEPIVIRNESVSVPTSSTLGASLSNAASSSSGSKLAYYGLFGVMLLGIVSLYATRQKHADVTISHQ